MAKQKFEKVFSLLPWLTILLFGGWAGLILIDIMSWGTRNVGILVVLFALTIFTWAIDSLMKDNPEKIREIMKDFSKKFFAEISQKNKKMISLLEEQNRVLKERIEQNESETQNWLAIYELAE